MIPQPKHILITLFVFLCIFVGVDVVTKERIKQNKDFAYLTEQGTEVGVTNIGYAPFNLTAPRFNCTGFLESTKQLSTLHIAFLYNTFGNDFRCLNKILEDPRLETLEINLINEPGHRNGRLGSYEFLYKVGSVAQYDAKLKKRDPALKKKFFDYVKPMQAVLERAGVENLNLLINPGLESNVSDASGKVLVTWAREAFPTARIVWNPLQASSKRRVRARADLIEGHGFSPPISAPCIYNMDGLDVSYKQRPALGEADYQEGQTKNWVKSGPPLQQLLEDYANRCEAAFLWTAEGNGLDTRRGGFVDPRKRNHNIPTQTYKRIMRDIIYLQNHGRIYPQSFEYSKQDDAIVKTCDVVRTDFVDGYKTGRLLKQSEFPERGGVILLPNSMRAANPVKIVQGTQVVDQYFSNTSYKDGSRKLFRSNLSPTTYPFKTYMVINSGGSRVCFKIENARIRLD